MRSLLYALPVLAFAACTDTLVTDPNGLESSASIDTFDPTAPGGCAPDCSKPRLLFESARPRSGPYPLLPARVVNGDEFAGVQLVTTKRHHITGLGALIYNHLEGAPVQMVFAIVPLDPATQLPKTTDLSDAIGCATGTIPFYPPNTPLDPAPEATVFPTSFDLPPGYWGLVVASDRLGVPAREGLLPLGNDRVATPFYFHYFEDGGAEGKPGMWFRDGDTLPSPDYMRFVIVGH